MAFTLAFTLPHVALLHSVTFYNISGQTWWAKCSPSCLRDHYPFLYLTITLSLLRPYGASYLLFTLYIRHYSPLQPSPLLYLIVKTIPGALYQ